MVWHKVEVDPVQNSKCFTLLPFARFTLEPKTSNALIFPLHPRTEATVLTSSCS